MKKTVLYPLIFIIITIVAKFGIEYLDVSNSPDKLALKFLESYPKAEAIQYLSGPDITTLKKSSYSLEQLYKIKISNSELVVVSTVSLSDKTSKVDIKNQDKIISLFAIQDSSQKWKISLNLEKENMILLEKEKLANAEISEDEHLILMSLKSLKNLEQSQKYDSRIESIENLILKKKEKSDYFKNLTVADISLKNNFMQATIKNTGSKDIKSVLGKIQLVQENGEIFKEYDVSLFDYIPGSFAFGQPIFSNHQKKIGFNVEKIEVKKYTINIIIVDFDFYEQKR